MSDRRTLAERVDARDDVAIARVAASVVRVRPDNLVERPWGGRRLAVYKGLVLEAARAGKRYGEAFELAADADDPECAAHPSVVVLEDGSEIPLSALLDVAGEAVLGAACARAHGGRLPILPKTLDIAELLSVQAHPPAHPELYVILDADLGATLRLGFARDVETAALQARLASVVRAPAPAAVAEINAELLALLNEIPVRAGDVLWNASPATRALPVPSADVHALGNPEGRELLVLEVRVPGPTWRLWDHGRMPARPLHIAEALRAVSPRASDPEAFRVTPQPLAGRLGVMRAVACAAFTVDLLRATRAQAATPPSPRVPRTLHVTSGAVTLRGEAGKQLGVVRRGESVLVPAALALAEVAAVDEHADAVLVTLPG